MKQISIIGDSISTYYGFVPDGYKVYYDEKKAKENQLTSVNDTWWRIVCSHLGAEICVNNSYSGSRVSGNGFPCASSDERTSSLHTENATPDLILLYIGANDFGRGIGVKENPFFYKEAVFYDAYKNMIQKIIRNYPDSQIVCATLMKSSVKNNPEWEYPRSKTGISLEEYNKAIREIANNLDVLVADLAALNTPYETLDTLHPTKTGHKTIALAWISELNRIGIC